MKFLVTFLTLISLGEAAAIAYSQPETRAPPFVSFEQWTEDIISNPNGKHLTPEEAVESHKALVRNVGNDAESKTKTQRRWRDDVTCLDTQDTSSAPAGDAVAIINYLASLGDKDCTAFGYGPQTFKITGHAWVWAQRAGTGSPDPKTDSCKNAARALGRIMDVCYRVDNTVKGFVLTVNEAYGLFIGGFYPE